MSAYGYLNQVSLIGRIGQEPELFNFESQKLMMAFSLATNDNYKNEEKTHWHQIRIINPSEFLIENLSKGQKIFCQGELQYYSYAHKKHKDITIKTAQVVIYPNHEKINILDWNNDRQGQS